MLKLDKKKLLIPSISAAHSNPDLVRSANDHSTRSSPLGDTVVNSNLIVSFRANHFSDDENDISSANNIVSHDKTDAVSDVSLLLQESDVLADTKVN